jgi:His-Xaa-Ser system protein HxsD
MMSTTQPTPVVIELDTAVYRLAAIKKAAYRFGDRCHILIEPAGGTKIRVALTAKRLLDNPQFLAGEFQNEVLDQELREVVAAETEGVRNLILAQAYAQTSLLDPQGDTADYHDDPLGISASDAQKDRSLREVVAPRDGSEQT